MTADAKDPSRAGGQCRRPCHADKDRAACCKAKRGVCRDADCDYASGAYRGAAAPQPPAPKPTFKAPATAPEPVACSKWATSCATYANPQDCCAAKPTLCYGANCIAGSYVTVPTFYGSTFQDANARPTLGASCTTWAPCRGAADPAACCARKPLGCDAWCDSRRGEAATTQAAKPMPGASCKTWSPCRGAADPEACCARKPLGCDAWCDSREAAAAASSAATTAFEPLGPGYFAPVLW